MLSAIFWWFWIEVVGVAALPLGFFIFKNLDDKGYFLSRILGLLLLGYLCWIVGFISYGFWPIVFCLAILAGFSYWRWQKQKDEIAAFFKAPGRGRYVAIVELLFGAMFLTFAFVRMHDSSIFATEKYMDFAFMNAITRSPSFPPHDPWMAGPHLYISYYYFGYLLISILNVLSGVTPAYAFNLAIATLFAMTGVAAFCLGYNMTRKYVFAGAMLALVGVIGNLEGILEIFYAHGSFSEAFWKWMHLGWDSWWQPGKDGVAEAANAMFHPYHAQGFVPEENWWWWRSTRVITHTITEFPFFSFLMADMHPHVMALPFGIAMLALCLNLVKDQDKSFPLHQPDTETVVRLAVLIITLGAFGFLNTWDYPTYVLLLVSCLFLKSYFNEKTLNQKVVQEWLIVSGVIVVASFAIYFPFYFNLHSQAKGIGIVKERTRFHHFFVFYGVFLWVFGGMLVIKFLQFVQEWKLKAAAGAGEGAKPQPRTKTALFCPSCGAKLKEGSRFCGQCGFESPRAAQAAPDTLLEAYKPAQSLVADVLNYTHENLWWLLPGTAALLVGLAWVTLSTAVFLGVLLSAGVLILASRFYSREEAFAWLLFSMGALLTFGCEFLHIRDSFGGDLPRMNTIFKFYYQGWLFWAVAAAYGLYYLYNQEWRLPAQGLKYAWAGMLGLLLIFGLLYPLTAVVNKSNHFHDPHPTLDGLNYMKAMYPADYDAIQWMQAHIKAGDKPPVILESYGDEYTEYARVSAATGLPTIMGWPGHEHQWRGDSADPEKDARINDVNTLYNSPDVNVKKQLLDKYDVQYVYVGSLERVGTPRKGPYDPAGLSKFREFMDVAYENFGVTIFKKR